MRLIYLFFPPIKAIGDIIYIYNLKLIAHGYSIQGKKNDVRDKSTNFTVFSGEHDAQIVPIASPISTIKKTKPEEVYYCMALIEFLRKESTKILSQVISGNAFTVTLNSISLDIANQDIYGYIEYVKKVADGLYHFWIWDGTIIEDFNG